MSHCPQCKQPLNAQCPVAGCTAHSRRLEWRTAATGLRYEVRHCEAGHTFVMNTTGRTARRYSRQLEEGATPASAMPAEPAASMVASATAPSPAAASTPPSASTSAASISLQAAAPASAPVPPSVRASPPAPEAFPTLAPLLAAPHALAAQQAAQRMVGAARHITVHSAARRARTRAGA